MNTTEKTYEMLWDCKYCGQKKLLGLTHRFCASCGGPQDASARYFPSDAEKIAVQDHPLVVGADVECPACKHWNARTASCCTNCGGPLTKGQAARVRQDQVQADGQAFAGENAQAARNEYAGAGPAMGAPPAAPPLQAKSKTNVLLFVIPAVLVGIIGLIAVMLLWKKGGSFEVGGHSWQRSVEIERFGPVRTSAWCDELPLGAHEVGRHREQRSTKKIPDGQDCKTRRKDNGNGTFKEVRECTPKYKDEPILGDKCDYEMNAWKVARSATAKGASVKETPAWPKVDIARTGACVGCEREGTRSETYTVDFVDPKTKDVSHCTVDQQKWASYADGSRWDGKVGVLTGALDCDSLKQK